MLYLCEGVLYTRDCDLVLERQEAMMILAVLLAPFMSKRALSNMVSRKISKMMLAARGSKFYRKLYRDIDITKMVWSNLPYVSKDELNGVPRRDLWMPHDAITYKEKTSGTTGHSFVMPFSHAYSQKLAIVHARNFLQMRLCPLRMTLYQWFVPRSQAGIHWKIHIMKKEFFLSTLSVRELYNTLCRARPSYLVIYPGKLLLLRSFIIKNALPLVKMKVIIVQGNLLPRRLKKLLEDFYEVKLIDTYGMTEFKEVAYQCPFCSGYHINSDFFYADFIPFPGHEEVYELILTALEPNILPLIRYRTGDLVYIPKNFRKCSRNNFQQFSKILGRKCDVIRDVNGRIYFPSDIVDFVFSQNGVDLFKCVQQTADHLEVYLEVKSAVRDQLHEKLRNYLSSFRITFHDVDFGEMPNILSAREKFLFVVNNYAKNISD